MVVTRIRLKQLDSEIIEHFHEIVKSYSSSLIVKDSVRKFRIVFTSPIELPKPINGVGWSFSTNWIEIYIDGERIK